MAVLFLIFLHQGIIAFSAVFLTQVIENFQSGASFKSDLYFYFAFMCLPYIPGYFSFVLLSLWVNDSHGKYVQEIVCLLQEGKCFYRNRSLRKDVESAASRRSFVIIEDALSFTHGFLSVALNGFLSFVVIGFILPGHVVQGYLASLVLCALLVIGTRRWIEDAAVRSERAFVHYGDVLGKIWPNIALKNRINRQAWQDNFQWNSSGYYGKTVAWELKKQSVNLLLAAFSLIPTVYLLLVEISEERSPSVMAVIMVNLTRIFHILGSLSALVSESLDWTSIRARMKFLLGVFDLLDDLQCIDGAVSDNVKINAISLVAVPDAIHRVAVRSSGRYTIRGSNASGKTTFLLALKNELGEKAVYFSPCENGLVWPENMVAGSTGQQAMHALHMLIEDRETSHLLLDEWDANLDQENCKLMDSILENEAKTRVVVEVRH